MSPAPRARLGAPLAALLAAVALAACGDDEEPASTPTTTSAEAGDCADVEAPPAKNDKFRRPERVLEPGEPATAAVETSCGSFEIALDTESSPKTANSFAFLAEQGFYDGTIIHRIEPGFVIQGGDPEGTGSGGPGYTVVEAPPEDTVYERGLVAMAKTAVEPPGASGSQFFVVTAPADAGLPPDYAVLGEVTAGLDVVASISKLGDANGQPTRIVAIDDVTIEAG